MKRSSQVPASLIVALASGASVAGCGSDRTYAECLDAYGNVVSDSYCRGGGGGVYIGGGGYHYSTRTVHYGGFGGGGGGFSGG